MTSPISRVLVLFTHPTLQKSRVNRVLVDAARQVEGVTVHDLYECYPDFDIAVADEQEMLLGHDVFVLQHPFFWYSVPAILKEWMDLVLEHGWAYGGQGTKLSGKRLMSAVSTGGSDVAYSPHGLNRYTMREFLRPIEQTARLCKMIYLPPFLVQGTHRLSAADIQSHAADYRRVLVALRDGSIDPGIVGDLDRINGDLDAVIGGGEP